jgi:cytosine deaminase
MDIVIKNGTIVGLNEVLDIGIQDGRIVEVRPSIKEKGKTTIEAKGQIVSPGFVDPHVHLDKCLSIDTTKGDRKASNIAEMVIAQRELKKKFTEKDVEERATRAALMSVTNGTTTLRTFTEADPIVEYKAVDGVIAAQKKCKPYIDIHTISFPQEGWLENEDGRELESRPYIIESMNRGIQVVGGNVNRVVWDSDPEQQVDELFELAIQHDADIDLHLDNAYSAVAFTLPYVAKKTIEHGYQGRVTGAHVVSLALVPDRVAHQTIELVKEAQVNICILPNVIRMTRALELFEAGVNVMIATDNLRDAFTRIGFGNADMLKAMLLFAQVFNLGFDDQLEMVFNAGTVNAAKGIRVDAEYGIAEGKIADIVVIDSPSISDAIRTIPCRRTVIKNGVVIAKDGQLVAIDD